MGLIELAEENFLITFAIVLGIGLFQGGILARGIRKRFPSLKRHARGVSVIMLILFSINALANILKFSYPQKIAISELEMPATIEEFFAILINVIGLDAGFITVIGVFVTITIIVFSRLAEIPKPIEYFIFSISIITLIIAVVGRFTDFVPTVFQVLMYAMYQFGITLGFFLVSRRKIDELAELK